MSTRVERMTEFRHADLTELVQATEDADVLVVQITPSRDSYVPITSAAIDRRLDQITANSALNAEISALEWARRDNPSGQRIFPPTRRDAKVRRQARKRAL